MHVIWILAKTKSTTLGFTRFMWNVATEQQLPYFWVCSTSKDVFHVCKQQSGEQWPKLQATIAKTLLVACYCSSQIGTKNETRRSSTTKWRRAIDQHCHETTVLEHSSTQANAGIQWSTSVGRTGVLHRVVSVSRINLVSVYICNSIVDTGNRWQENQSRSFC